MNGILLNAIVANADEYCRRYLAEYSPRTLQNDWWEAFDFFLAHACFQGRLDKVSERVYQSARQVLKPLFDVCEKDQTYDAQKRDDWKDLLAALRERIGKGKVGKQGDVKMVISALSFIEEIPNKNIVAYSVGKVKSGRLQDHYRELQRAESRAGIFQVGPKIAAFYLRDVVSLFDLTKIVDEQSAFCLQPVDTWVRKVAEKLGMVDSGAGDEEIKRAIVKMCHQQGISALRFNQGAWYTGYHAFELLLVTLAREN